MYDAVLTGKDSNVVGKQQLAFDVKYFPLKDCGKTNPHLSTLYRVLGRTPRPAQFTNTSTSISGKSDGKTMQFNIPLKNLMLVNKQGG
jgi:hypothetical protein